MEEEEAKEAKAKAMQNFFGVAPQFQAVGSINSLAAPAPAPRERKQQPLALRDALNFTQCVTSCLDCVVAGLS